LDPPGSLVGPAKSSQARLSIPGTSKFPQMREDQPGLTQKGTIEEAERRLLPQ
jgi:hypothetical protein